VRDAFKLAKEKQPAIIFIDGALPPPAPLIKYISGVLPEKARLAAAGAIKVNIRETYTLLSIEFKCLMTDGRRPSSTGMWKGRNYFLG
jgi:hypothetical protein